ncbi:hypothetical protein PM10SUCC1_25090 [Propionigenium maris DSM 9537]|uniref:Nucleoid associated protein NdpA n=1 Tax=Propionigenium maris DSM 9537 TaxID=1123000 RepID=A0A9W6GMT3_9FUSO|nr:nucleoid-associated protein [Propionigenium maris]GLI56995.1 hypothetical protein PM10SUCC1_25090 [Propionigenium maris DSM 9537]
MDYRALNNINLKHSIVHILNNREDDIKLSNYPLNLNTKVEELLLSHINSSISGDKSRVGNFDSRSHVKDLCNETFENNDKFIEKSIGLAQKLFSQMKRGSTISPANFIICLLEANNRQLIALLKLDFKEIFETQEIEHEDGLEINIVNAGTGLPSQDQKLQKCAFYWEEISEEDEQHGRDYDIILLDKQRRKQSDTDIAGFFMNFLECSLVENNTDRTKEFVNQTKKFLNKLYKEDPEGKKIKIDLLCETIKNSEQLNIHTFSNLIFGEEESSEKTNYLELMSKKVKDLEFQVDKDWVKDNVKKKVIKVRGEDIKITLPYGISNDPKKFEITKNKETSNYDITIKNVQYDSEIR